ncbi:MAG: hypothetical protein GYB64_01260 [Chloroflexi bacterium]|nr:hypothetical protein [Chloroflexota bacterium]
MPRVTTVAQDSSLATGMQALIQSVWPVYMLHSEAAKAYWDRLFTDFPEYQLALVDDTGRLMGMGSSIPVAWQGSEWGTLPDEGWDWAISQGFVDREAEREPTLHCAFFIGIDGSLQGQGLSTEVLLALKSMGAKMGFPATVIPLRPMLKPRYPLMDITQYAAWRRDDGQYFDPWLRVHERVGGFVAGVARRSKIIAASRSQWEEWLHMALPFTGHYVIPGALAPLEVDREAGQAVYTEPNIWMVHRN